MATNRITALRERKRDLLAELEAVQTAAGDKPLGDKVREQWDANLAEVEEIGKDLERYEALLRSQQDAVNANPPGNPPAARPGDDIRPARGARFADLFGPPKASPFKTNEEFLSAVHEATTRGMFDPRLGGPELRAVGTEGQPAGGGYSVPEPMAAQWLDPGIEDEVVRPRASVYRMTADSLKVAAWDDTDHSAGAIAGFTATWIAEGASIPTNDGKTRRIRLEAKKLAVASPYSNELLEDGQDINAQIARKMPDAVSWALDYAFLNGTGSGQPTGILNDPALVVITKETSQPTGTFFYENAVKMYERLAPGGYANAVWIVNHSVVPQLLTMNVKIKNVAGTENVGGSMVPVLTADGNGQLRLLGLPVVKTEKVPALSTKGDVILADLSQYAIGIRREILLEGSRHAGWSTDTTSYRAIIRVDGMGTWNKPLTVKAGTSRSWCVVLENR